MRLNFVDSVSLVSQLPWRSRIGPASQDRAWLLQELIWNRVRPWAWRDRKAPSYCPASRRRAERAVGLAFRRHWGGLARSAAPPQ